MDSLTSLRQRYADSYRQAESRAAFVEPGDEYLAADSTFGDAVFYGAIFGDPGFVRRMFSLAADQYGRALATGSYSEDEANQISKDFDDHRKHFGLFVAAGAAADQGPDFEHFDRAAELLAAAVEPELGELVEDSDSGTVLLGALALSAQAVMWRRPNPLLPLLDAFRAARTPRPLRPIRDTLVVVHSAQSGLPAFDAAFDQAITLRRFDTGIVNGLTMSGAYDLALLRTRGDFVAAATELFAAPRG